MRGGHAMVTKRWRVWPAIGGARRKRAWAARAPKQFDVGHWWSTVVDLIASQIIVEEKVADRSKVPGFLEAIEAARREWVSAKAYFDNVTEADLVDHAIFTIEAAEKKYMYLLKRARELGIRFNDGALARPDRSRWGSDGVGLAERSPRA